MIKIGGLIVSKGSEFLPEVLGLIEKRLGEIDKNIQAVRQDINSMNEYYWDNYTEMDQYGYEDYDNQQALKMQVNANQENWKMRRRLKRMLDAPFFGSVEFAYDGEDEPEDFYIGIGNFARERGALPLIYDWRAPVSSLFYDYDKGEASYEAPGGRMDGEILSKWQYKIRGGKMIYEFESDVKIDDDILKQELGANSDTKLKNIVRTIQKEQNAIIRNTKDKILAIQGVAGSGKTSVALHRIAYLLYHDREHLNSSNILILSPGGVFADYISHILPELGEENIQEMSFDLFAYHELRRNTATQGNVIYGNAGNQENAIYGNAVNQENAIYRNKNRDQGGNQGKNPSGNSKSSSAGTGWNSKIIAADCEDKYHQIEREIAGVDDTDQKRYEWKQSVEYVQAIEGFLIELEDRLVDFEDVEFKGIRKSASEIMEFFYEKYTGTPLLDRMGAVMDYFIDEVETLRGRSLNDEEQEIICRKFMNMYVTRDICQIYNWFLEDYGFPALPDMPPERRVLEYEDVYPILYLKYSLTAAGQRKNIRHLVIDEMQDYSYLQYVLLAKMFSCNMTILGDKAQTIAGKQQDVLTFLPKIFGKKVKRIVMNKSYRNTSEIAEYAKSVGGSKDIQYVARHGKAVERHAIKTLEKTCKEISGKLKLREEEYETAAILTMTEKEAEHIQEIMHKLGAEAHYINRDSAQFKKGLTVTTYYLAKGLEFDQVFIVGGDRNNKMYQGYQYICATRALHELYVYDA